MKTLTAIPTMLALTIQVMVVGQTQGNQARKVRMDISAKKEIPTSNILLKNAMCNLLYFKGKQFTTKKYDVTHCLTFCLTVFSIFSL